MKATFLRYFFLMTEGLHKLAKASPGGARRNRILRLTPLEAIGVPVPALAFQEWFDRIQTKAELLRSHRAEAFTELDKLMPAMLDGAFTQFKFGVFWAADCVGNGPSNVISSDANLRRQSISAANFRACF